ncbi:MAG: DUF5611 family protein [Methanosarcinales archaeon]|nr:DUF5611 family protein [Methanosarcinales archaeon]
MTEYKLKRGFKPEMERIREAMESAFPATVAEKDGKLLVSYGALKSVEACIVDKKLCVETVANPDSSDEEILESNKAFRQFLNDATGYNAKQRAKMAKKDVQN